jgi:hypothetical protein
MSNIATPSELLNYPLPNIKSVIMAVLRPELRALANIYEEEIAYMRASIDTQNMLLAKIQGYFAEQNSQIIDRIIKELELSLDINKLKIQKVDLSTYNNLVDDVSTLGKTLSVYVEIVDRLRSLIGGHYPDIDIEDISTRLDNIQSMVSNLQNTTDFRIEELQTRYNEILTELQYIRDLIVNNH